jgi:hypothetical protein
MRWNETRKIYYVTFRRKYDIFIGYIFFNLRDIYRRIRVWRVNRQVARISCYVVTSPLAFRTCLFISRSRVTASGFVELTNGKSATTKNVIQLIKYDLPVYVDLLFFFNFFKNPSFRCNFQENIEKNCRKGLKNGFF